MVRVPLLLAAALLLTLASQPAAAYLAYVSNEKSNTVSVIDTSKWEVVRTIKVGQRPRGIAITKDQRHVLVAVGDDDTIQMIDTATHEVVDTLPSGPDPELFVQDAAGAILYVANENDNTVTIIDIDKRARLGEVQVGVEPEGMGLSPDGKILVSTSETTNMAHFIDTSTREIVANILVDARPRFAEFKQDGSELWVSSEIGGTLSIIDPAKREVKKKISFEIRGMRREAIQPVGIKLTRDGRTGFVALGPANRIAVVDGVTHEVSRYVLVGQRVWQLALTPDERYLLSTNGVSNDVSVIEVATLKAIKTIQVGELPLGRGDLTAMKPRGGCNMSPRSLLALAIAIVCPATTSALAADPRYPDWPCVQAKVPEISAAAVWAGPPLGDAEKGWEHDRHVRDLIGQLAPRRVPLEDAKQRIADFVTGKPDEREERGRLLFAGLLERLNRERTEVMSGIERLARRQKEQAERIRADISELHKVQDAANPDEAKLQELSSRVEWSTRIFDDRHKTLRYVCEVPTLIEQRLFALARAVQESME